MSLYSQPPQKRAETMRHHSIARLPFLGFFVRLESFWGLENRFASLTFRYGYLRLPLAGLWSAILHV